MARWRHFLPRIVQAQAVAGVGEPDSPLDVFVAAWLALLGERAATMRYDARLAHAAQGQAEYLASRADTSQSMHIGRYGSTANERVAWAGYSLPEHWPARGNQVESATRSWDAPDEAARDLANHDTHRDHVLGIGWFAGHTVWGCGWSETYYVLVSCPIEYQ